jgi:hypothetical protein
MHDATVAPSPAGLVKQQGCSALTRRRAGRRALRRPCGILAAAAQLMMEKRRTTREYLLAVAEFTHFGATEF